ncbi:MAG: metal ABC transporter permease, partial [Clostridia bacterium]
MSFGLEIQIIAIITSVACSILGVFLMLRGMTMIIDSITHTILLGIVIAFLITNDLKSPLLLVFATITGVFTVWLTELLVSSKIVTKDSSISIIFPLLFSIAIILISKFARNTHLCVDTVLLGEIASRRST